MRHGRKAAQESRAVAVDAHVPQHVQRRHRTHPVRERIARPGNERAAEVQGHAARIEHDFHDVGVGEVGHVVDRVGRRRHLRIAPVVEQRRDRVDERRVDQRFVALHVHDGVVAIEPQDLARLRQPVAARCVVLPRQHSFDSVRLACIYDRYMVGGDNALRLRPGRLLRHAHDHRQARDIGQGLVRQARGREPRRNEDREAHQTSGVRRGNCSSSVSLRVRASCSSRIGMPSRIG